MDDIRAILEELERQDLYKVTTKGMSSQLEEEVTKLCILYRDADAERRVLMRRSITGAATVILCGFVVKMATMALQRHNVEAITLGVAALDLSNIAAIDRRDAVGPIAKLTFAAQECGINLAEHAATVVPTFPPILMKYILNPAPVKVGNDVNGNLVFQRTGPTFAEYLKSRPDSRRRSR